MTDKTSLNVVVDGIIYQLQAHGGISRIFSEILPRMCQIDETVNFNLLMTGKSQQALPHHPNIHIYGAPQVGQLLKPQRLWQRYLLLNPLYLWNILLQYLGWKKFVPTMPNGREKIESYG